MSWLLKEIKIWCCDDVSDRT